MSTRKSSSIALIGTLAAVLMLAASPASAGKGHGHGFKRFYFHTFTPYSHQYVAPRRDCSYFRYLARSTGNPFWWAKLEQCRYGGH
jgi:hypothetical protein